MRWADRAARLPETVLEQIGGVVRKINGGTDDTEAGACRAGGDPVNVAPFVSAAVKGSEGWARLRHRLTRDGSWRLLVSVPGLDVPDVVAPEPERLLHGQICRSPAALWGHREEATRPWHRGCSLLQS